MSWKRRAERAYHHGNLREALLADVAREGFQRFEAMLSTGWAAGKPDALTAFNNVGRAYLAFARAEPAYYAAMFESGLPPDLNADLRAAADRAFGVLRGAAEGLVALLPAGKRPPALMMSLHVWAMAHGIASLFGRGDAGRRSLPMTAEELLESQMLIYLQGLGFPQKA